MSEQPRPRILLVEDDPDTAGAIGAALGGHFGGECVRVCPSIARALIADPTEADLVLCDMDLPDGTALTALEKFLERRPDLPFVLLVAEAGVGMAIAALRRGAYDYLVKSGDYLPGLPLVVEKNLAIWRMRQENLRLQRELTRTLEDVRLKNRQLEEAVRTLESAAATDPLTNLANRRAFTHSLERSFAEAGRYGHDLACLMLDLDGFKQFNDACGHQRGDELLRTLSRVLEANCRRSDVAGRYGGDEFIVLLPQTDLATARVVADRITAQFAQALEEPDFGKDQRVPRTSLSLGLACLRHSRPTTPDALVSHADHALYSAKEAGKACLMVYSAQPVAETRTAHG